ncbi:MAG: dihydrofolate reductase family protein [Nocardioides sp.]
MRLLLGPDGSNPADLTADQLRDAYLALTTPWLRVNMVSTLDGAATGESGRSGSINNQADKRVFDLLRELADALVVGAGTARIEGYRPADRPTVVVSRSGRVPDRLRDAGPGRVLMATCQASPRLEEARRLLGNEHVLVLGSHRVHLGRLKQELADRGFPHLLCEGGPHLLRDLLDQGVVDEVTATVVPRLLAGAHPRITDGPPIDVPLQLHALLEEDDTLLGRWLVR